MGPRTSKNEILSWLCGLVGMVIGGYRAQHDIAQSIARMRAKDEYICGMFGFACAPIVVFWVVGGFLIGATLGLFVHSTWKLSRQFAVRSRSLKSRGTP